MLKNLIKFSISSTMISTTLIPTINIVETVNEIQYGEAAKKTNEVRNKIDDVIEALTKTFEGIDRFRDVHNDDNGSTNFEFYYDQNPYVLHRKVGCSDMYTSWADEDTGPTLYSCVYKLYGEEIVLNPYYITTVSAISHYVITSGNYSWETIRSWFKDKSVTKYELRKNFKERKFYVCSLGKDKKSIELYGNIDHEKPNASIYMRITINSSDKGSVFDENEHVKSHTGWAHFDGFLFYGRIMYSITDESREKIEKIKQRISDLKADIKNEINDLNSYNPNSDSNIDYENSNLKSLLAKCERAYQKAADFIASSSNNYWIKK